MDDGYREYLLGVGDREVVGVGVVVVVQLAYPVVHLDHGDDACRCRYDALDVDDCRDDVALLLVELPLGNECYEEEQQQGYAERNSQCYYLSPPAVPLLHGAEVFVEEYGAVEGYDDDEIAFDEHPCVG